MTFKASQIALMIALLAAATVVAALGFEHIGGYVPCALCLKERIPYYVGAPVALLAAYLLSKPQHIALGRVVVGIVGLIFLTSAGLGIYHAGAEWGFWPGPTTCGGGGLKSTGAADLLSSLEGVKVIKCDEASWRFLGLSFAGWNGVASLGLVALSALALRTSIKKP